MLNGNEPNKKRWQRWANGVAVASAVGAVVGAVLQALYPSAHLALVVTLVSGSVGVLATIFTLVMAEQLSKILEGRIGQSEQRVERAEAAADASRTRTQDLEEELKAERHKLAQLEQFAGPRVLTQKQVDSVQRDVAHLGPACVVQIGYSAGDKEVMSYTKRITAVLRAAGLSVRHMPINFPMHGEQATGISATVVLKPGELVANALVDAGVLPKSSVAHLGPPSRGGAPSLLDPECALFLRVRIEDPRI